MSCLIALDTLKTLNGIAPSDTSQDAALRIHIQQCSARIEEYCGRKFNAADYTEYLCGTGDKYIATTQRPINSIASVYVDNSANWGQSSDPFPATTLLDVTSYAIAKYGTVAPGRAGLVYRSDGVWDKFDAYRPGTITPLTYQANGNVKITYNAGYTTIPYDLQQACAVLVSNMRRIVTLGMPVISEGWSDYSYAVGAAANTVMGALPPDVAAVLGRYRNQAVG